MWKFQGSVKKETGFPEGDQVKFMNNFRELQMA